MNREIVPITPEVLRLTGKLTHWYVKLPSPNSTEASRVINPSYGNTASERASYRFLRSVFSGVPNIFLPYSRVLNGNLFVQECRGSSLTDLFSNSNAWDLLDNFFAVQRQKGKRSPIELSDVFNAYVTNLLNRIRHFVSLSVQRGLINRDDFDRVLDLLISPLSDIKIQDVQFVPVHGDLHPGNIIVDTNSNAMYVIDPMDSGYKPHAIDLNKFFGWFFVFYYQYEINQDQEDGQNCNLTVINKLSYVNNSLQKVLDNLSTEERLLFNAEMYANFIRLPLGFYNPKNTTIINERMPFYPILARVVLQEGVTGLLNL